MLIYAAPLTDWQFLLHDVLRIQDQPWSGFSDLDASFTAPLLQAAAHFHEAVLHPMNLAADQEGAHWENGQVRTPKGFREAWEQYREAGWHRLSIDSNLGGFGLPPVLAVPITELRAATGHSFSMYSAFCAPAATMLEALAPEWVREHVVPRLVSGEWTATMCMTEAQAGTDLRQIRTRAVAQADGTWRLQGNKIFISGGDHDLTDNIVHIVLAKMVEADGLSKLADGLESVGVFMVPKRLIDTATGVAGAINGVTVSSIEHKMGIEASATCVLNFDDAVAWRISDDKQTGSAANMAPMFLLMNYARVGTAMSGVAYADLAQQNAAQYARERYSGRSGRGPLPPGRSADPIIAHADVRRLLLESRAFVEGARAGALQAALWQTEARQAQDAEQRRRATDLLNILTPVMKAYFTDRGFESTVACQQVYGGHGYIKDYGIEQCVRNARIGQLYEGANGIQAMDFVQRKLTAGEGRACRTLIELFKQPLLNLPTNSALNQAWLQPWVKALEQLERSLQTVTAESRLQSQRSAAGAYDLLTAVGITYVGWSWLQIIAALESRDEKTQENPKFHQAKLALARVWIERQMPLVKALCERADASNKGLLMLSDEDI